VRYLKSCPNIPPRAENGNRQYESANGCFHPNLHTTVYMLSSRTCLSIEPFFLATDKVNASQWNCSNRGHCQRARIDARCSLGHCCRCRHVCALWLRAFSAIYNHDTRILLPYQLSSIHASTYGWPPPCAGISLVRFQLPESARSLIFVSCGLWITRSLEWRSGQTFAGAGTTAVSARPFGLDWARLVTSRRCAILAALVGRSSES
jgi:hypothetical protein